MQYTEVLDVVQQHCSLLAKQYNQDRDEFFSYVLVKVPGMVSRMDTKEFTLTQCKSFIKKSIRGYCLHYLRDESHLIKTPRSQEPYTTQPMLDTDPGHSQEPHLGLPEYIEDILETPHLRKRISNAYLRYLDT